MATNKEWLFSLPLDELYAWFNSEHHESGNHGSDGSTAALESRIDELEKHLRISWEYECQLQEQRDKLAEELERRGACDFVPDGMMDGRMWLACTSCNGYISASYDPPRYCPHCGAKVGEK